MELVLLEVHSLCILAGKMYFFSFSCQDMFHYQNILNSLRNVAKISLYSYLFVVTVNFYWSKLVQVVLCKCTTRGKKTNTKRLRQAQSFSLVAVRHLNNI